jgi:MoaA/NifB/PqqE/SkfB family radical SAM enzyme
MKKTVSFTKNSTNIFFHITTQCNLRCRHCYINPEQHGRQPLTLSKIASWLKIFIERSHSANVIFLGGEPTLHPDLSSAIKKARRLGAHSITVDTNGYLFHDILSKIAPDDVDYFSFSLDGASRETNDAIRGKGSYDTCIDGIRRAVSRGFSTSLIFTVSRENIRELPKMVPIAGELKIERFFIQVIGIRGASAKPEAPSLQVPHFDWLKVVPETAEKIADLGIIATYPKVFLSDEETFACAGLVAENYFIFPNGRIYRCPLCEDYPLHSMMMVDDRLTETGKINERDLFDLTIPEGCVMNKIIQPENLSYQKDGTPKYKVACCMLKEEISPEKNISFSVDS